MHPETKYCHVGLREQWAVVQECCLYYLRYWFLWCLSDVCVLSIRCLHPLFYDGITAVAMEHREVELTKLREQMNRSFEKLFVGAIFAPTVMPLIHVAPMNLVSTWFQLIPLNSCMQNVEDVIKCAPTRNLSFESSRCTRKMRLNIFPKMCNTYSCR